MGPHDPARAPAMTEHAATTSPLGLHSLADYVPLIGEAVVERIRRKVARLHTFNTCHISSTYYGGGVSEMLSPLTLLLNDAGIATGWRILQGTPEFFAVTKAIHNGLQGADPVLTSEKKEL